MAQRNQVIDFIRGISILLVILLHCAIHLPIDKNFLSLRWMQLLFNSGYYGVIVFFVVSGFLITSTSIRKWNNFPLAPLSQFYLMRFTRIMPCLVALLLILSFLHWLNVSGFIVRTTSLERALFSVLTFHVNWLEANTGYLPANWDVLWSLSVEETFYLFFPIACLLCRKQRYLVMVMLVFILLGPLARTKLTGNDMWSDRSYLSCMDSIAIGCLAAMFGNNVKCKKVLFAFFIMGTLLFGFVFCFRRQAFDLGLTALGLHVTVLAIGIAFILMAIQELDFKATFMVANLIQYLGRNSYEIYLTHSFVVLLVAETLYHTNQPTWLIGLEYMLIVFVSGVIGMAVANYYSQPINSFLRSKQHYN